MPDDTPAISSSTMAAAPKNGNVKTATVAAVLTAVVLAISGMAFLWRVDSARSEEQHKLDKRVTRLEAQYQAIDGKLDTLIKRDQ